MNYFIECLREQANYPKLSPVLESALEFPYAGPA